VRPIRRVWDDLVLPLVSSWGSRRKQELDWSADANRGRIIVDDVRGPTLSWIFVDLSREFTPCFKLLVPDLDS